MVEMIRVLALVLGVMLAPVQLVAGCGMLTHNSIAHRASEKFASAAHPQYREYILDNTDAFQAGAPFPDWGYACGYHAAGEAAHWEPFQLAAVAHIHETYPQPWTEHTKRLVAFLLGVASHYVADINWHGLGEKSPRWATPLAHGFLKALGGTNYGCGGTLCSVAHTAGDTGGEFMSATEFDTSFLRKSWYLPTQDVLAIYKRLNFTNINATSMENCVNMFFLASQLEHLAGSILFPLFASKSPYLSDMMQAHPVGGIDDNALWSTWKWRLIVQWLESNTTASARAAPSAAVRSMLAPLADGSTHPLAPGADAAQRARFVRSMTRDGELARRAFARAQVLAEATGHRVLRERSGRGMLFTLHRDSADAPANIPRSPPATGNRVRVNAIVAQCMRVVNSEKLWHPAAEDRLHAVINDCLRKVLGSQQFGVWYDAAPSPPGAAADSTLRFPTAQLTDANASSWAYFGRSMASGDFNGDGQSDLAIGSPGFGAPGHWQTGKVLLYYGTADGVSPDATPVEIASRMPHTGDQFGWTLAVADLNKDGLDDLVVGAPSADGEYLDDDYAWDNWRGRLEVMWGSHTMHSGKTTPDVVIVGDERQENANIGRTLTSADLDGDGFRDIVVGAQYAYGGNGTAGQAPSNPYDGHTFASRGYVAAIMASSFGKLVSMPSPASYNINDVADWTYRGTTDFEFAGMSISAVPADKSSGLGGLLVISSPQSNTATGKVTAFQFGDVGSPPTQAWQITGAHNLTEFARATAVGAPYGDGTKYLFISAPVVTPNNDIFQTHAGVVYGFPLSSLKGSMTLQELLSANKSALTLVGGAAFGRLGHSLQFSDVNGDGVDDLMVSQPLLTTLGGILEGIGGAETGAIHVLMGGSAFPKGTLVVSPGDLQAPHWSSEGLHVAGRLGYSGFVVSSIGGCRSVLAASPRSQGQSRPQFPQAGRVYSYMSVCA